VLPLRDRDIGVVGLGRVGRSVLRFLLSRGARVRVSESRPASALAPRLLAFLEENGVRLECGGHTADFFAGAAMVVPSPGVDLQQPWIRELRRRGVALCGELALAAGRYPAPVLAVTGTNGKTTVCSLLGRILADQGYRVFVGGNIGTPLLDIFFRDEPAELAVLELSSFQLELAGSFSPQVGCILNVEEDHLDRHGDLATCRRLKARIVSGQTPESLAVLWSGDPWMRRLGPTLRSQVRYFGERETDEARVLGTGVACRIGERRLDLRLDGTQLADPVNRRNAAAALLCAASYVRDPAVLADSLRSYVREPHRLQTVAEVRGVRYVDDSKATNVAAVRAALETQDRPVLLIAGGQDKDLDFRPLRPLVASRVKRLVVLGEAAAKIGDAFGDLVPVARTATLEEAVALAAAEAGAGDVVLLSPGCASFDMFQDFRQRGERFAAAVRRLANEVDV